MIKYNNSNINDWDFGTSNIVKVYRNNAVCYYKITSSGGTSGQTPCFAVVDDISQYSDREFVDVYNNADEKWYKLNNLNQYEEYGVYGSGRTITYYDGKLTIDGDYEYQYSGNSWVNVGEISGSTVSLPDVPFSVNYNAKNYDSQTKTLLKTSGQLADVDAVITAGTPTVGDGYLTIATSTRAAINGYQSYFNRDNNNPSITIVSKQLTNGSNCHMFANRDSNYNWMYRPSSDKLSFHGSTQINGTSTTTQPVIESIRVSSNRLLTFNNYTDNTSTSTSNFSYGSTNSGKFAIFAGYGTSGSEWFEGNFYWVYMSQNTLTDEQVQQVIDYNEGGGGQPIYPIYYSEKSDPPNNLSFSSMTEAEEYQCPWVGMEATIDGVKYIFSGDSISGYEWVINPSRLPEGYTEVEYIQNQSMAYLELNFKPNQDTRIVIDTQIVTSTNYGKIISAGQWDRVNGIQLQYETGVNGTLKIDWGTATRHNDTGVHGDYDRHVYDWNKNYFYRDETLLASTTYGSFQCTCNLLVFMASSTSCNPTMSSPESELAKLYSLQVYNNDVLTIDLVPCKNPSNIVGAYDIVNDVFYSAANQNYQFVAGPAV